MNDQQEEEYDTPPPTYTDATAVYFLHNQEWEESIVFLTNPPPPYENLFQTERAPTIESQRRRGFDLHFCRIMKKKINFCEKFQNLLPLLIIAALIMGVLFTICVVYSILDKTSSFIKKE